MRVCGQRKFRCLRGCADLQQLRGRLLRSNGHQVMEYTRTNSNIVSFGLLDYATFPVRTIWNWQSYSEIKCLLKKHRPEVT